MFGIRMRIAIIVGLLATAPGCLMQQKKHSIVRAWADYNTLGHPAAFLEQIDHRPYRSARVGDFRWMYNQDPGHRSTRAGFWRFGRRRTHNEYHEPTSHYSPSMQGEPSPGMQLTPPPESLNGSRPEVIPELPAEQPELPVIVPPPPAVEGPPAAGDAPAGVPSFATGDGASPL